jgi:hypothetical protein
MRGYHFLILLILFSCNSASRNTDEVNKTGTDTLTVNTSQSSTMAYKEQLEATKEHYPFSRWRESHGHGLEQYTQENCDKARAVFDLLIVKLTALGQDAGEKDKVELFKTAVLSLNKLNDQIDGLIETGEREDLCELLDKVTIAAGMNPKNYAGGDGIADEWREW